MQILSLFIFFVAHSIINITYRRLNLKTTLMYRISCSIVLLFTSLCANAQQWELHVTAGSSSGKLLPLSGSTPASAKVRYGVMHGGSCFSPELVARTGDHSRFTLGYQLAFTPSGVWYMPQGRKGPLMQSSDVTTLHSLQVGYAWRTAPKGSGVIFGAFAKAGMAYNTMSAIKEHGSSGTGENVSGFSYNRRFTGFEVRNGMWTPVSTIGLTLGANSPKTRLADRLSLNVSATMVWKDPYLGYSRSQYAYIAGGMVRSEVVSFRGNMLMMQACVDYALFRFRSKVKME